MSNRAELIELVENWLHPGPQFPIYILGNNNPISQVVLKVKSEKYIKEFKIVSVTWYILVS